MSVGHVGRWSKSNPSHAKPNVFDGSLDTVGDLIRHQQQMAYRGKYSRHPKVSQWVLCSETNRYTPYTIERR